MKQLEGKVSLITGGSRGIGLEIARELARRGSNISICYVSDKTEVEKIQKEIEENAVRCILIKADVSKLEEAESLVKKVKEELGSIDILVNNAGITKDNLIMRMTEEEFNSVIDVNLKGAFHVTKQVVPIMMKQRNGKIINISSVVGVAGNAGQCNYAASKAGIIGMTKSLAKELSSRNILVNAVAPGFIKTDMTDKLSEEQKENIEKQIPLKRLGDAKDVAKVVSFLASEDASYITGQVINVDGGMII